MATPPMTRLEMLARIGLGQPDFDDYVRKYADFYKGLNPAQQDFHRRNSQETVLRIAMSLGPNAQPADVQALFAAAPASGGIVFMSCCR